MSPKTMRDHIKAKSPDIRGEIYKLRSYMKVKVSSLYNFNDIVKIGLTALAFRKCAKRLTTPESRVIFVKS